MGQITAEQSMSFVKMPDENRMEITKYLTS